MSDTTTSKIAELNDRFRKASNSADPAGISLGKNSSPVEFASSA